jgi:hypothetical protein
MERGVFIANLSPHIVLQLCSSSWCVHHHLELLHLEAAALVELDILLRAVENDLIAALREGNVLQLLDDPIL